MSLIPFSQGLKEISRAPQTRLCIWDLEGESDMGLHYAFLRTYTHRCRFPSISLPACQSDKRTERADLGPPLCPPNQASNEVSSLPLLRPLVGNMKDCLPLLPQVTLEGCATENWVHEVLQKNCWGGGEEILQQHRQVWDGIRKAEGRGPTHSPPQEVTGTIYGTLIWWCRTVFSD